MRRFMPLRVSPPGLCRSCYLSQRRKQRRVEAEDAAYRAHGLTPKQVTDFRTANRDPDVEYDLEPMRNEDIAAGAETPAGPFPDAPFVPKEAPLSVQDLAFEEERQRREANAERLRKLEADRIQPEKDDI